mgnify:CR=1 FL=1
MGNSVSQRHIQNGGGYVNNFSNLQNTVQRLVRGLNNGHESETINFHDNNLSSDIDFESIQEFRQMGGDFLTVKSRRARYQNDAVGGGSNLFVDQQQPVATNNVAQLDSINENDIAVLKNILEKYDNKNAQNGGDCPCNASPKRFISATSPEPVTIATLQPQQGGGEDDDDDDDDEDSEDVDIDDDTETESDEDEDEDTETDSDDEDEEETDESSSEDKKMKRATSKKMKRIAGKNDYVPTESGSKSDIVINDKLMYSEPSNSFYDSDGGSEYYRAIKNRSFMN